MSDDRQQKIMKGIKNSVFLDPEYKQFLLEFVKSTPGKYLENFEKYIQKLEKEQNEFIQDIVKKNPDFLEEFKILKKKKIAKTIRKKESIEREKEKKALSKLEGELK
jgi:hypothetical protein